MARCMVRALTVMPAFWASGWRRPHDCRAPFWRRRDVDLSEDQVADAVPLARLTVDAMGAALEQFARVSPTEMGGLSPAVRDAVRHAVELVRAALRCAEELVEELEFR